MTPPLKIAVMGAGSVGCYYGGMLARAGHEVVLIARPQHVEAVPRDGLRIETKTFDERVRLAASTDAAAVQGAELVLFCVKSTDTESRRRADAAAPGARRAGPDPAERRRQRRPPAAVLPKHRWPPPWSTSPRRWPAPDTSSTTAAAIW